MRTECSGFLPAFGADHSGIGCGQRNQLSAVVARGAICPALGIDDVSGIVEVDAAFDTGCDKGASGLFRMPCAARFKAALGGVLAALALCLEVGALETTTLCEVSEEVRTYEDAEGNADAESDEKTGDGGLEELSEKGSWIHHVTFCMGFTAGLYGGVGVIYALIMLISKFLERKDIP